MNGPPSSGEQSRFWRNVLVGCGVAIAVGAFFTAIVVVLIWQSVSWLKNAGEPNMAQYEPVGLSRGEEEDVARVMSGINEAKQKGDIYDEYVTPRVFNGAVQKIIADEQRKGTAKPDAPLFLRGSFVDDRLSLRITLPAKTEQSGSPQKTQNTSPAILPEGKYINAEVVFELEIVEGEIMRAKVHKLVLRGRDAPLLSRWVVNYKIGEIKEDSHKKKNDPANPFWAVKLLRRENDRLHVMLDGARMREQETKKERQMNADKHR